MATDTTEPQVSGTKLSRDFWKYWIGQTISNLGNSVTLFALPLLVYQLTGSAVDLGIATAMNTAPYLLFGLVLGAWTDRVDRKRMMIFTDVTRAAVIAIIPLLVMLNALSVWCIYAVGFLHSTLTICFDAGEFAAIPSLVQQSDLVTANGRIQASYSAASVAGPLVAGFLVGTLALSIPSVMTIDALSFLVSALSLILIRRSFNTHQDEKKLDTHILTDVIEGLRYVLKHPVLRNISLMMVLDNFIFITVPAQLVLFANVHLHTNNTQIGLFFSIGSLGIIVFALAAGPLRKRWPFSKVALSALAISGLLTLFLALIPWYWLSLACWACISGLGMLFNINTGSLRQTIVPNHMLGRVMSIASVLATAAIPLGSLLGGAAVSWTGNIVLIYSIIGVLLFILPLIFSFTALGHAERYITASEENFTS